ncbi:unnamed protein product [Gadus morhua 'NCC']
MFSRPAVFLLLRWAPGWGVWWVVLLGLLPQDRAVNLDTQAPLVKHGAPGSLFGLSVALHQQTLHRTRSLGTLQKRDQAKTGAGMPEVKPITTLEEKILAVMGQVYTQGISTGTNVGLPEEVLDSVEVSESTAVILTLMDSECDSRTLPTARIIPSPGKLMLTV